MTVHNFRLKLADSTWQAAQHRAGQTGQPLEEIVADLLTKYAGGETEMTTYTVQQGDTLAAIARDFYGDSRKFPVIQAANKIENANQIWVGQVLLVPAIAAAPFPSPSSPTHSMQNIPTGFNPDRAGNVRAVYQFQLVDSGSAWTVTINNGTCTVGPGHTAEPDVTIGISNDDLQALARGQLNIRQAWQEGQLGLRGDAKLATRFTDMVGPWEQTPPSN